MKESFGDVEIATREYYNWQYLRNPAGNANLIMAYHNEEAAGQIACISCRYKLKTEEIIIPLTLNLCVVPKFRGRGLMSQLLSNMHKYLEGRARFSIGVA